MSDRFNPTPDVSCKYGAPMGRGWPHLTGDLAASVAEMYAAAPPRTAVEARHAKVAKARALYDRLGVDPATQTAKVRLVRVRLDNGGYDAGGAYWGLGAPLYCAASDCGTVDMWLRARSRDDAKAQVRAAFPRATFFR